MTAAKMTEVAQQLPIEWHNDLLYGYMALLATEVEVLTCSLWND